MTSHDTPTPAGQPQATDAQRQLAALVDEYAEPAEPTSNTDLMTLLFQIRMMLGDDPAQAGQQISRRPTPPP